MGFWNRLTIWLIGLFMYHYSRAFRDLVDRQVAADEQEAAAIRRWPRRED